MAWTFAGFAGLGRSAGSVEPRDQRLASVLLALPPGRVTVRSFFEAMAAYGLDKEHYCGAWRKAARCRGMWCRAG